jgi:hypothetical protein
MRFAIFLALAALLLGGCTSDTDKGLCPAAAILAPTAAITVFRDNAPSDPSGELFSAWMTNVKARCDYDKDERSTDSRLTIVFRAKRSSNGQAASYRVPYFVTVTHGGDKIMTKKIFLAQLTFEAGEAEVSFEQDVDSTVIKLDRGTNAGDYQILTGFQLTQKQLEYNKQNHRYVP